MDLRRHLKKLPLLGTHLIEVEALRRTVDQQGEFLIAAENSRKAHALAEAEAVGTMQAVGDQMDRLQETLAIRAEQLADEISAHATTKAKLDMALERIGALVAERDGLMDVVLSQTKASDHDGRKPADLPVADPRGMVAAIRTMSAAPKAVAAKRKKS